MPDTKQSPKRSSRWVEVGIIVALVLFGVVYLWSKVEREEPTKFSDRSMPQAAQQALALGNDGLQKADQRSLTIANVAFGKIMAEYPDYPPARAKWALTSVLLARIFDQQTDTDAAAKAADSVLAEYPDEKDALLAKAFLARPEEADMVAKAANKVLKQERYDVYALYLLAQKSATEGKHKLALRYAETLALQDPMALWLRAPRCEQSIAVGNHEKAVTACEWAFGNQPKTNQGKDLLARAEALG